MNRWDRLDHIISRIEKILIVFLLSVMMMMAFSLQCGCCQK